MEPPDAPVFDRDRLRPLLVEMARDGVHLGTSSWKYPGWVGSLYTRDRYLHNGRFSQARFERLCLAEYAGVFHGVGVDAAYYAYPSAKTWTDWTGQVPPGFLFSLKVTDEITLRTFPRIAARFGPRAGQSNPHYLDPRRFENAFLQPLTPFRHHIGILMFEFTRFSRGEYARGRDFIADLDRFLSQLPGGWLYGVELRNRAFLHPDYFGVLARHGVTHVFNSWEDMPPVAEQMSLPGAFTTPDVVAARFLLRPGRSYAEAVRRFQPYSAVVEPVPDARMAGATLIADTLRLQGRRKAFLQVNNRLEGYALGTIAALVALARSLPTSEGISDREQDGP